MQELARIYRYCKLFNCSPAEYESRPFRETNWMLKIDDAFNEARNELQEQANRRG